MDKELRRLERIFHESGTVEDEARLLRERLRVGRLNQRQIEIASYLEYPAARLIIETPITICSILDGTNAADTIAEAWEAALDPPEVLFAAMLVVAKEITATIEEEDGDVVENIPGGPHPLWDGPGGPERRAYFMDTLNYGLRASALGFAKRVQNVGKIDFRY